MRKYNFFLFFQFCRLVEKLIAPLIWFSNLGKKAGNGSLMFSNFTKTEHIVKWFVRSSKYSENNRGWALLKSLKFFYLSTVQSNHFITWSDQDWACFTPSESATNIPQSLPVHLLDALRWTLCLKALRKTIGVLSMLRTFFNLMKYI